MHALVPTIRIELSRAREGLRSHFGLRGFDWFWAHGWKGTYFTGNLNRVLHVVPYREYGCGLSDLV